MKMHGFRPEDVVLELPIEIFNYLYQSARKTLKRSTWNQTIELCGLQIGRRSQRLRLLKRNPNRKCTLCGMEGTKALLMREKGDPNIGHIQLFGIKNDTMYAMTLDHIKALSHGGRGSSIDNYQLMCAPCNNTIKKKMDENDKRATENRIQASGTEG